MMQRPSRPRTSRRVVALAVAAMVAIGANVTGSNDVARAGDNPNAFDVYRVDGTPVHWNRCQTIGYRINLRRAPANAVSQINEAVRRLEHRSGLNLTYRGTTRVFPGPNRRFPRDARLIIGWTVPSQSEQMPKGVAGVGGFRYTFVPRGGGEDEGVIIKGYAQFNANLNDDIPDGFGKGNDTGYLGTKGQIMMHELGHAVGLKHVDNKPQIMYPQMTTKAAKWGKGDVNGLKRVGIYRDCVAAPSAGTATRDVVSRD